MENRSTGAGSKHYLPCFTIRSRSTNKTTNDATGNVTCMDRILPSLLVPFSLTLGVSSMENGEGDGAVHLVLTGDDHGVEQPTLSCIIQRIRQGHCRTQVYHLHRNSHVFKLIAHQVGVVSARGDGKGS